MSAIKDITICFCIAAVVLGAVSMLNVGGATEKTMKIVIGIAMLSVIVMSFKKLPKPDLNFNIEINAAQSEFKGVVSNQVLELSKENLKSQISDVIKRYGVNKFFIEISMDIADNNCISIKKIEIYLNEEGNPQAVESAIKKELGLAAIVKERK
ncbi:MAG: hypothetical protein RR177_03785 [Oscillospiraceae bacterium]